MDPKRETPKVTTSGGDWVRFVTHADNPERKWKVRKYFSAYGGRCYSYTDVADCESMDAASVAMEKLYLAAKEA